MKKQMKKQMRKLIAITLATLFLVALITACAPSAPSGTYTYEPELFGISTGVVIGLRFSGSSVTVTGDVAGAGLGFEAGTFSMDGNTIIISAGDGAEIRGTYNKDTDTVRLLSFEFTKN